MESEKQKPVTEVQKELVQEHPEDYHSILQNLHEYGKMREIEMYAEDRARMEQLQKYGLVNQRTTRLGMLDQTREYTLNERGEKVLSLY